MKRLLYAFFLLNIVTIFVQPSYANGNGNNNHFSGLWQGIDSGDGSLSFLSISDANNDGVMTIRLGDTFFSMCKEAGYAQNPGLVEGTGTVQNMVLTWDYSFKCYNPTTNKLVELRKGSIKLHFNSKEDIIVDDEGEIYHHVSNHK